jgi:hypothetical protein
MEELEEALKKKQNKKQKKRKKGGKSPSKDTLNSKLDKYARDSFHERLLFFK